MGNSDFKWEGNVLTSRCLCLDSTYGGEAGDTQQVKSQIYAFHESVFKLEVTTRSTVSADKDLCNV